MPVEQVRWTGNREQDFKVFIDYELRWAQGYQQQLVEQWIRWEELYRAPIKQPERRVPYEGAANFMLPVIATTVDQLFAKFVQTIHAADNLWELSPLNERWVDAAKPLQDFLTWLDHSALHMKDVNDRVFMETVKLGTGIYKTYWEYERRSVWGYDEQGRPQKQMRIKGIPRVDQVRLADFVLPPNAYSTEPDDQNGAVWVAERLRPTVEKFQWWMRSQSPLLPAVPQATIDLLKNFWERGVTDYDAAIQSNDYDKSGTVTGKDFDTDSSPAHVSGGKPGPIRQIRQIELWEIHARYPTRQESDSEDDIIVWYHQPTKTIVRAVYNYFHHGKRPYDVIRYQRGAGFYGVGVCEQTELFQTLESDLTNFQYDNVLLANSRMIVAKAGQHIAPGEPVYPYKVWITDDDVDKAFRVFPMADIYQSLPQMIGQVQSRGEKRNGVGDIQLGSIDQLPGRTPATTMLSLLQEGNRRPDLTTKNMRDALASVGLKVIQLCQQFMTSVSDVGGKALLQLAVQTLGTPEGGFAADKLTMPAENAEFGVGVSLSATSGTQNKEVAKQNYLSLLQLAGQLSPQFIQLMQVAVQAQGSPVGQIALNAVQGMGELYEQLLRQYDIRDTEEINPVPTPGQQAQAQAQPGQPAPVPPGNVFGPPGATPLTGPSPSIPALSGLVG